MGSREIREIRGRKGEKEKMRGRERGGKRKRDGKGGGRDRSCYIHVHTTYNYKYTGSAQGSEGTAHSVGFKANASACSGIPYTCSTAGKDISNPMDEGPEQ